MDTFEGWVYIDNTGAVAINTGFQVADAGNFAQGLAPLQTNDGWGYIDENGIPVINPKFTQAGSFSEGLAWVMDDEYFGYIDQSGETVIPYQFAEVKAFNEDFAAVRISRDWYYIHAETGTIAFNQPFDAAESFRNGIARVRIGDDENARYGYINTEGEYIWYPTR